MKLLIAGLAFVLSVPMVAAGAVVDALKAGAPTPVFAGDIDDLGVQVLSNPRIRLSVNARKDVEAGRVDGRVLGVLLLVAAKHELGSVGPFVSGHSYFVKGTTRVSNHVHGRAVDISVVNGVAVSSRNAGALEAVRAVLSLPAPMRPDEVGSPWDLADSGSFADDQHATHLHFGWRANPESLQQMNYSDLADSTRRGEVTWR